jgi:hypothetical protein
MNDKEIRKYIDSEFFNALRLKDDNPKSEKIFGTRLEPRTRKRNMNSAVSFCVHDPLWALTRQWQFGEFKGNDTGSAVIASAKVNTLSMRKKPGETCLEAMEPMIEQMNMPISLEIRVESALYARKLMKSLLSSDEYNKACDFCKTKFPLDKIVVKSSVELDEAKKFTREHQPNLTNFISAYWEKAFDGYQLYNYLKSANIADNDVMKKLSSFIPWFSSRYLPNDEEAKSSWDIQKLGYQYELKVGDEKGNKYKAENYHSGRLSWYSFDTPDNDDSTESDDSYHFVGLPTPASFPGAPNKRLWQFEDHKVYLGNSNEMQSEANAVTLQFSTMFGNDWMIIPLDVVIGSQIHVENIEVTDTFGNKTTILQRANGSDKPVATFGQNWEMFTTAHVDVYNNKKKSLGNFFFPPSLQYTIESEPIEEIQFLRDEMSNMVWAVENRISDESGSSFDAGQLANDLYEYLAENFFPQAKENPDSAGVDGIKKADYKYVLQNSVPLNWIPFIPQRLVGDATDREINFRRAKMPILLNGKRYAVRPLSSLLAVSFMDSDSTKEEPLLINEEEIQAVGTQISMNYQRARWLNGKTYTWLGAMSQIKQMQGNSGLMFDELLKNE